MTHDTEILVRGLKESDLPEANRILRTAFAAFLKVDDATELSPGRDLVSTRWRADPTGAIAAEHRGTLMGTVFLAHWGTFGFLGPITVLPEFWGRKIAQALLESAMSRFDEWGITHRGLFTFPQSPKHIHLYEKYGFRTGHLTPILVKDVGRCGVTFTGLTRLSKPEQRRTISNCEQITDAISPGLNLRGELLAVVNQGLGEVCLICDGGVLVGFAICHCGPNTEAGDNHCYVKFGAVRHSEKAGEYFGQLLEACEAIASEQSLGHLSLGVNMGRRQAYEQVKRSGFRTEFIGVAMETDLGQSYNQPEIYVIDDWR